MYTIKMAAKLSASEIKKFPDSLKKAHDFAMKATKNGTVLTAYNSNDTIKKAIDGYLLKLTEFLKQTTPKKTSQNKNSKPGKSTTNKQTSSTDVKYVEDIDIEIQFISKYKNLHGKVKTKTQIANLLKSLQKAITRKQIKAKSRFAKEIDTMQESLIKLLNKMERENLNQVQVNIDGIEKYKAIAASEKRLLSVTYMLRFIALTKKPDVVSKAERLQNQIDKSIKTGKIKKTDKYFNDLETINKKLRGYINGSSTLEITKAQLNGLSRKVKNEVAALEGLNGFTGGSAYAAGFFSSMASRYIYDKYLKPKTESNNNTEKQARIPETPEIMNSQKLKSMKFDTIKLDSDFAELIGEPSQGAAIMIYGGPGSGKSTFEVLFAKSLAEFNNKKVLIITDEEGFSKTMQEKLDRLNAYHNNIFIAESIPDNINDFDVVMYDSVQSLRLTPEQLEDFHKKHPKIMMLFVFQVTKEGKFKGEEEFEHLVDVVLHAENGIISSQGKKNRFGGRGEVQVY